MQIDYVAGDYKVIKSIYLTEDVDVGVSLGVVSVIVARTAVATT